MNAPSKPEPLSKIHFLDDNQMTTATETCNSATGEMRFTSLVITLLFNACPMNLFSRIDVQLALGEQFGELDLDDDSDSGTTDSD
jgi:hypothetical protein